MWMALFPLRYPRTCATAYFGGMESTCGRGRVGDGPPPPRPRAAGPVPAARGRGASVARRTTPAAGTWESTHHGTLHSHLLWAKLSLSSMEASWDGVSFERFTAQEAFVFSRNCQTRGVARQSRGVT